MKERPILFSGPMVRAILEGRKTVTRRVVKPAPQMVTDHSAVPWEGDPGVLLRLLEQSGRKCPYGQPGDRLWVRESLRYDSEYGHFYAAGGKHGETVYLCSLLDDDDKQTGPSYDGLLPERSVPSIHLHRRYSRILLEITAVRVERLQEITEQQALAEGIDLEQLADSQERYDMVADHNMTGRPTAGGEFRDLWASINGIESWDANPWCWVVEFKRVAP